MSGRAVKRAKRALKERQQDYDSIKNPLTKSAMKRPGSLNPKKSHGGRSMRRK